jgi:hypothetical protein
MDLRDMKFKIKLVCLLLVIFANFFSLKALSNLPETFIGNTNVNKTAMSLSIVDPSLPVSDASDYPANNYNATVDVTFQVDMSAVDIHAEGVYLAGGDIGQEGHLMTNDGNDVLSVTVSLNVNQTYLYKFRNQPSYGTWDGFEDPAGLIAGGCSTGIYNDRYVDVVTSDIVLPVVHYGSCTQGGIVGCTDQNATNYDADVTVQALDQWGNILCTYASCDDVPTEGCMYANSFAPWNEKFESSDCTYYGGTPCEGGTEPATVSFPIGFEGGSYTFTDFDGGATTVVANPDNTGANNSANVAKHVRYDVQTWAGTYLISEALDFSTNNTFTMKVYAPAVNISVLLKLEAPDGEFVELTQNTTVANQWEELTYNFGAQTSGFYTKVVIIFNLGVLGDGTANSTYYFDDIVFTVNEVRIVEFTDVKMEIYPNPARDQFHLIVNNNFDQLNMEVVNPLGISLIHKEMKDVSSESVIEFDIDHLPKGVYVLRISTNGEMVTTIPWMKQ